MEEGANIFLFMSIEELLQLAPAAVEIVTYCGLKADVRLWVCLR
jgi:hypothetical protein